MFGAGADFKWRVTAATLVSILLAVVFYARTPIQFRFAVWGDGAYFADMAQSFYLGTPPQIPYSTMHSRRILAPAVVGGILRGEDLARGSAAPSPVRFSYEGHYPAGWYLRAAPVFDRLLAAWRLLDFVAFLAIGVAATTLVCLIAPHAPSWQTFVVAFTVGAWPALGRLYFAWPFMNDLPAIALGLVSLLLLVRAHIALSGLVLGIALLGRENLLLVYPCYLWVLTNVRAHPLHGVVLHGALTILPYTLVSVLPPFPNVRPFADLSTGIQAAAAGIAQDYWALVTFHVERMLADPTWSLRAFAAQWNAGGPLLLLVLRAGAWRGPALSTDWLLWSSLLVCMVTSFGVDRYLVYGAFPLLLLLRHAREAQSNAPVGAALVALYLSGTRPLSPVNAGQALQVETMTLTSAGWTAIVGSVAVALVGVEALWRARRQTTVPDGEPRHE